MPFTALTLILSASIVSASNLQFKPKLGMDISLLNMSQKDDQALPFLQIQGADAKIRTATDTENNTLQYLDANSVFYPTDTTTGFVNKDNLDGVMSRQVSAGIEISYIDEHPRPSAGYQFAPIINLYGTMKDMSTLPNIAGNMYHISLLPSAGGDFGLLATNNGNFFTLGAGAKFLNAEIKTAATFSAIADVVALDNNAVVEIDTTSIRSADKKAYSAKVNNLMMPYIYFQASTEIGDVATGFINIKYGIKSSPKYTDAPQNTQMFSGDAEAYGENSEWQLHAATFGIMVRVDDFL